MLRKRLIWRPNEIPLDVWEAMSRDEQIAWWKSQPQEPPRPKPHMKKVIESYNKGILTVYDFINMACKLAEADEVDEFVRECPADLLAKLKEYLAETGDDPSKLISVHFSCYAPWVTPKEIEEAERIERERQWEGVLLLKKWFAIAS